LLLLEDLVEEFLNQGQALANEDGRQAHLNGKVAAALMEKAEELLADKLPG
jgi:hypothetical protein